MTAPGLIVKLPRAFQVVVLLHFAEDARSDEELRALILGGISASLSLGGAMKAIAVQPVAYSPIPGPNPQ